MNPLPAQVPTPATAPSAFPALVLMPMHGTDAAAFLQSQLTCDVAGVQDGAWTWFGHCTPAGRLLVTGRLGRAGDGFLLQVPEPFASEFAQRLRKYVLRSKVVLGAIWGAPARACRSGAVAAATGVAESALPPPGSVATVQGVVAFGVYPDLWLMHTESASHPAEVPADAADLRLADALAGAPWVLPATREAFIPQMIGLDAAGGVSFTKGCYPGQEIVARARYRGTVKRGPYRARASASLAPGTPLESPRFPGQPAGTVLQSAPQGAHWVVHAVVEHTAAEGPLAALEGTVLLEAVQPAQAGA